MINNVYLTPSDVDVIKVIKEEVNGEGIINVRRICIAERLSKPSFFLILKTLCLCNIIDSRSLGVKGTWVKIKDNSFFEAF